MAPPAPTMMAGSAAAYAPATLAPHASAPVQAPPRRATRKQYRWYTRLLLLGIGLPLFLLGGLISLVMTIDMKNAEASRTWPTTNGIVTKTSIGTKLRTRDGIRVPVHKPNIEYKYRVDGLNYDGDRIQFGWPTSTQDRQEVEAFLQRYPRGKQAVVYYNAKNPKFTALQPGLQDLETSGGIRNFGIVAFLVGLFFCGKGFRGKKVRHDK